MSEENKGVTINFKATGWVEKVVVDKYSTQVVLRSNESEDGIKFPQRMIFNLSKKLAEKYVPAKGEKIEATIMPWLNEGVSKSSGKEYCIGKLIATKVDVLVPAEADEAEAGESASDPEDLPF